MLKLYFYTQFVITLTSFNLSCSFSGSNLTHTHTHTHTYIYMYIYRNMDGLNALKFVHTLSVDIMKFVCSSGELVHMMLRL